MSSLNGRPRSRGILPSIVLLALIMSTVVFSACREPIVRIAPDNVQASDGGTHYGDAIYITFTGPYEALRCELYRATDPEGEYRLVRDDVPVYASGVIDDSISAGRLYYYKMRGIYEDGPGPFSEVDSGFLLAVRPVSGLSASMGEHDDRVELVWNAVLGASGYRVTRAGASDGYRWDRQADLATTDEPGYVDETVASATAYRYEVVASFSDEGLSSPSATMGWTGDGWSIDRLEASKGTRPDSVNVMWASIPGVVGYDVYRSADTAEDYLLVERVEIGQYIDEEIDPDVPYFYRVQGVSEFDETVLSPLSYADVGYVVGPPTNVRASEGTYDDYIKIEWDAGPFPVEKYMVGWTADLDDGFNHNVSNTTTETSFEFSGYTGVRYYFHVQTMSGGQYSAPSAVVSGYEGELVDSVPDPPNRFIIESTDATSTRISWYGSYGRNEYRLYRSTSASVVLSSPIYTGYSNFHTDTGLSTGTTYYYVVTATNAVGTGPASTTQRVTVATSDTGGQAAPSNVRIAASAGSITISWDSSGSGVTYHVAKDTAPDGEFSTTVYEGTALSCVDDDPDTLSYYRVGAEATDGMVVWASPVIGVPSSDGSTRLAAPTSVDAANGASFREIDLSWQAVAGATVYQVERSGTSSGPFEIIGSATRTEYADVAQLEYAPVHYVNPGTTYYYRVQAIGQDVLASPYSAVESGSTSLPPPPGTVEVSTLQIDPTALRVSWSPREHVEYFTVYRSLSPTAEYERVADVGDIASNYDGDMLTYVDAGRTPGVLYFYAIASNASGVEGPRSVGIQGRCDPTRSRWSRTPAPRSTDRRRTPAGSRCGASSQS